VKLYAESSAVLSWLLADERAEPVREALSSAEFVIASDLTLVECDRVLVRSASTGRLLEPEAKEAAARLSQISERWVLIRLDAEILERARRPFPREPLRTLDALHLASALAALRTTPDLALLSLDQRVRRSGRELGLTLLPDLETSGG
jgi:predicted nucleic acid-binding protein